MKIKGCKLMEVLSCNKNENVVNIAIKLKKNKKRHLVVTDNGKPVGIISSTDIVNKIVAEKRDFEKTKAGDIMTSPIITKDINDSLSEAYIFMIKNNFLFCPITEKNKLKGNLGLHETMKELAKDGKNKKNN